MACFRFFTLGRPGFVKSILNELGVTSSVIHSTSRFGSWIQQTKVSKRGVTWESYWVSRSSIPNSLPSSLQFVDHDPKFGLVRESEKDRWRTMK